jgi:excinuclease ABC subunit B
MAYNEKHGIIPRQAVKAGNAALLSERGEGVEADAYIEPEIIFAADPVVEYMTRPQLEKAIEHTRKLMTEAAKKLEFIEAAQYRDEMIRLEEKLKSLS